MKKNYFMILIALFAISLTSVNAEVDKTVQKKKVVLEEFTGIHCGYCPDGHKRATDLMNANPGKVSLINIHAGGYATPGAGEIDLRTADGTKIDAASGVTGYPAGSVNRSTSPWAKDRGQWASMAAGLFNQTSPVNVAVDAAINTTTMELTVNVEYYYTANGTGTTNKLFVALVQDSILGTQSDYGNYNPTNWTADKKYIHNHVLRMMVNTGATAGDDITAIVKGSTAKKTYTVTLPKTIANIAIDPKQLQVVAYIANTTSTILTGEEAHVSWPGTIDMSIKDLTSFPTDVCSNSISPKAEVTNISSQEITSFDMMCSIYGKTYTKSFKGTLAQGATTTIDFGTINFTPSGATTYKMTGFANINGGTTIQDFNGSNNSSMKQVTYLGKKAFNTLAEGFDDPTVMPANMVFDYSVNPNFKIFTSTNPVGANSSIGAILFYLHSSWGIAGKAGKILMGEADFANFGNPEFNYYYAYSDGTLGGTAPTMKVEYSLDCGATWKTKGTVTAEETNPGSTTQLYFPTSDEYKKVTVNLYELKKQGALLRFSVTPGSNGNALWIDEFSISEGAMGINDVLSSDLSVTPNVNDGKSTLTFSLKNDVAKSDIYLVDLFGNRVCDIAKSALSAGNHSFTINASNLVSGKYFVVTNLNNTLSETPVIIAK